MRRQRGSILILTYVTLTGLLIITIGYFSRVLAEHRASLVQNASVQASALADAGMEEALNWLRTGITLGGPIGGEAREPFTGALAGGTYTASIQRESPDLYRVIARGTSGGVTDTQTALVETENLTKYLIFAPALWNETMASPLFVFKPGDVMEGDLHLGNFFINDGTWDQDVAVGPVPQFLGHVGIVDHGNDFYFISAGNVPGGYASYADYVNALHPTRAYFAEGVTVGAQPGHDQTADAWGDMSQDDFNLAQGTAWYEGWSEETVAVLNHFSSQAVWDNLEAMATHTYASRREFGQELQPIPCGNGQPGCQQLYVPAEEDPAYRTQVRFQENCSITVTRALSDPVSPGTTETFPAGTVLYIDGVAEVAGTVCGANTVTATQYMKITDNLVYKSGYAPESPDILGLVAGEHVEIGITLASASPLVEADREVHALIYTGSPDYSQFYSSELFPGGTAIEIDSWGVWVQTDYVPPGNAPYYTTHPDYIPLNERGTFTFVGSMNSWVGFVPWDRNIHYIHDNRAITNPPPGFPTTGSVEVLSWTDLQNSAAAQPAEEP